MSVFPSKEAFRSITGAALLEAIVAVALAAEKAGEHRNSSRLQTVRDAVVA